MGKTLTVNVSCSQSVSGNCSSSQSGCGTVYRTVCTSGGGYQQWSVSGTASGNPVGAGCTGGGTDTWGATGGCDCDSQSSSCGSTSATANLPAIYQQITGCTDPNACNYDATANVNSGCDYESCVGCLDPCATNYCSGCTQSGGGCNYPCGGGCQCNDCSCATYGGSWWGDYSDYTVGADLTGIPSECLRTVGTFTYDGTEYDYFCGGSDSTPDPGDGVCDPGEKCRRRRKYKSPNSGCGGCGDVGLSIYSFTCTYSSTCESYLTGCIIPGACNFNQNLYDLSQANFVIFDQDCDFQSCVGCTDPTAENYLSSATQDDGSCEWAPTAVIVVDPATTVDEGTSLTFVSTESTGSPDAGYNASNIPEITSISWTLTSDPQLSGFPQDFSWTYSEVSAVPPDFITSAPIFPPPTGNGGLTATLTVTNTYPLTQNSYTSAEVTQNIVVLDTLIDIEEDEQEIINAYYNALTLDSYLMSTYGPNASNNIPYYLPTILAAYCVVEEPDPIVESPNIFIKGSYGQAPFQNNIGVILPESEYGHPVHETLTNSLLTGDFQNGDTLFISYFGGIVGDGSDAIQLKQSIYFDGYWNVVNEGSGSEDFNLKSGMGLIMYTWEDLTISWSTGLEEE